MKKIVSIDLLDKNYQTILMEHVKVSYSSVEISNMNSLVWGEIKKKCSKKFEKVEYISVDSFMDEVNFMEENHYLKQLGTCLDIGSQLNCNKYLCEIDTIVVKGNRANIVANIEEKEMIKNLLEILTQVKRVGESRKKYFYFFPLKYFAQKQLFERVSHLVELLKFIQINLLIALNIETESIEEVEKIFITFGEYIELIRVKESRYEEVKEVVDRVKMNENVVLSIKLGE